MATTLTEKECSRCRNKKPLEEFSKRKQSKDGLNVWCKTCVSAYNRQRTTKKRVRRTHQKSHRRVKYGLEPEHYKELCEKQNGLCAICDSKEPLLVDHDHNTGDVRGLLCRKCNTGLGFFGENLQLLLKAADYLRGVK